MLPWQQNWIPLIDSNTMNKQTLLSKLCEYCVTRHHYVAKRNCWVEPTAWTYMYRWYVVYYRRWNGRGVPRWAPRQRSSPGYRTKPRNPWPLLKPVPRCCTIPQQATLYTNLRQSHFISLLQQAAYPQGIQCNFCAGTRHWWGYPRRSLTPCHCPGSLSLLPLPPPPRSTGSRGNP